jgi:hypothetical protein
MAFRHVDHLELAWNCLRESAYDEAEHRMRDNIRAIAAQAGAPDKYHETITVGWMRLVAAAMELSERIETFPELMRAHQWLLDKDALLAFYSRERLMSDEARSRWVAPDLKPLPVSPRRTAGSPARAPAALHAAENAPRHPAAPARTAP